jgi:hypothetical protein
MNMLSEKRTLLVRSEIVKAKIRAIQRGVWFQVLTRMERACVDVAIIVIEKVRSCLLQKVLSSIMKKLEKAVKSQVQCITHEMGEYLASKLSQIAKDWGNKSATRWIEDAAFIRFLTVTYMNTSHDSDFKRNLLKLRFQKVLSAKRLK